MNLAELKSEFYRVADDKKRAGALWDDDFIVMALNKAQRQAAENGKLLMDRTTPGLASVSLVANQRDYALHPSIFDVPRAKIAGYWDNLYIEPFECLDLLELDAGTPRKMAIYDGPAGRVHILLDRAPQSDGILNLTAYRYPLADMVDPEDEPEINPGRHADLVHWALYLAYLTRDSDATDQKRAVTHRALFEQAFGPTNSASVLRKRRKHRAPVARSILG